MLKIWKRWTNECRHFEGVTFFIMENRVETALFSVVSSLSFNLYGNEADEIVAVKEDYFVSA